MAGGQDDRVRIRILLSSALVSVAALAGGCFLIAEDSRAVAEVEATAMVSPSLVLTRHIVSTDTPLPTSTEEPVFSGERAMFFVAAQMAIGPRPTGSVASREVGDYILGELDAAGWHTETQAFAYQGVEGRNLIGRAGSSEPGGPFLVLAAHYDTRREADMDPIDPTAPVPGANDGASGVAVLLELAYVLDLNRVNSDVWFVFFDAEDNGRLDNWEWIVGSREFADRLEGRPDYVIVVDMVGDADQQIYYEANSYADLQGHIWQVAHELGYGEYFIKEVRHSMLDDHIPFVELGIPAVDIIDFDYPYWHTTEDTLDKVSAASLGRVGRTLEVFLESGAPIANDGSPD